MSRNVNMDQVYGTNRRKVGLAFIPRGWRGNLFNTHTGCNFITGFVKVSFNKHWQEGHSWANRTSVDRQSCLLPTTDDLFGWSIPKEDAGHFRRGKYHHAPPLFPTPVSLKNCHRQKTRCRNDGLSHISWYEIGHQHRTGHWHRHLERTDRTKGEESDHSR